MDKILQLDRDVFLTLNSLGSENWDGLWLAITNKYYAIPIYAFLLWLIIKKLGLKENSVAEAIEWAVGGPATSKKRISTKA